MSRDWQWKYSKSLVCYSKPIVDAFRITPDSAEYKRWEAKMRDTLKKEKDKATYDRIKRKIDGWYTNFTNFMNLAKRQDIFIFSKSAFPGDEITYRDYNPNWLEEMPVTGESWPVKA